MEAFGAIGRQQLSKGLDEYCRILAIQMPEAGEDPAPHRFSAGFFEQLCNALADAE